MRPQTCFVCAKRAIYHMCGIVHPPLFLRFHSLGAEFCLYVSGVHHLFLFRWNVHVVTVEVVQVFVGRGWCTEGLALEGDGREGEDGILAVHDAIAVVDENV